MRLCYFLKGRHTIIHFSVNATMTSEIVLQLVKNHKANFLHGGKIHNLFLDFEGEHILVHNEEELDMACRLISAYHNNCIRQRLQVRFQNTKHI